MISKENQFSTHNQTFDFKTIAENFWTTNNSSPQNIYVYETYDYEWLKYWKVNGEDIVNQSWNKLNSKYIDAFSKKFMKLSLNIINPQLHWSTEIKKISRRWIKLWEEHYEEQYTKTFYEWFELNIRKEKRCMINTNTFDYVEIDQTSELLNLGLPTSFGRNTSKEFRKEKKSVRAESRQNIAKIFSESIVDSINEIHFENNMKREIYGEIIPLKAKKRKNRHLRNLPSNIANDKRLFKYWKKRFSLFSKFDQGIQLDEESWFSVTPEKIAIHISEKLSHFDVIVDGFCGCGGNTIQFAKKYKRVVAIDIDPIKIRMAKNNAKIYNVEDKIDFIIGDFFQLSKNLKADGVFLSPPWGGPNYSKKISFDMENDLQPAGASYLLEKARCISSNIALYLPRNSDINQIVSLAGKNNQVQIEHNYFGDKIVALTAFFGDSIKLDEVKK